MKARQVKDRSQAGSRAIDLGTHLRAIRREQGQLVAELVWNEMRAWEIKCRLEDGEGGANRSELERDLDKRLALIQSMAEWEEAADLSLGKLRARLRKLLDEFPEFGDEAPDLLGLCEEPGLEPIARGAACDLGLRHPTL
jgi:hypothetical protein